MKRFSNLMFCIIADIRADYLAGLLRARADYRGVGGRGGRRGALVAVAEADD